MERVVYRQMAALDERHWWYRARREVLAALIARTVKLPKRARILEIGCGTGHNLGMLAQFGDVDALELDDEARQIAEARLGRSVISGRLPDLSGVGDEDYDLVAALDVIEHIDADLAAVETIAAKLKPQGTLVVTVPAHRWMWSAHDVVNHHKRRYSKRALKALIEASPLKLKRIGYLNSLLFPAAIMDRMASKLLRRTDSDLALPPRLLNTALERTFAAERHLIGRLPLPPGLSLFAIASAR